MISDDSVTGGDHWLSLSASLSHSAAGRGHPSRPGLGSESESVGLVTSASVTGSQWSLSSSVKLSLAQPPQSCPRLAAAGLLPHCYLRR